MGSAFAEVFAELLKAVHQLAESQGYSSWHLLFPGLRLQAALLEMKEEGAFLHREAVQQRVRDSAWSLVRIYVGLTAFEVVILMLLGMTPYVAVIHSFGTLATGGFSSHSASVAFFASWQLESVIVIFMFMAGINFGLYDTMLRNGWHIPWE